LLHHTTIGEIGVLTGRSKRLTLEPIAAQAVAAAGRAAKPATKFELKVDGEWNATSSGGNMSHAEWRVVRYHYLPYHSRM
jgi:hypothetical protein